MTCPSCGTTAILRRLGAAPMLALLDQAVSRPTHDAADALEAVPADGEPDAGARVGRVRARSS